MTLAASQITIAILIGTYTCSSFYCVVLSTCVYMFVYFTLHAYECVVSRAIRIVHVRKWAG